MADLGFLGGGQLARMSIQAAQRMGLTCLSLDPGTNTPASQIAESLTGRLDDVSAIAELAENSLFLALENEFIPATAIAGGLAQAGVPEERLALPLSALTLIQDKLAQRKAFMATGVPSPRALALNEWLLDRTLMPLPVVLKARFGGYDGKGTRLGRNEVELGVHLQGIDHPEEWLVEEFVDFVRELAVMVFITPDQVGTYPTVETRQVENICDLVLPCPVDGSDVAIRACQAVGAEGLVGVELFETRSGAILVNELAPRPHNTGHYTLDWGGTSQFEQHVRISCQLPVDPTPRGVPTVMANLVTPAKLQGAVEPSRLRAALRAAYQGAGVHVHWYGKTELRPGRKVGHINSTEGESSALEARERFWAVMEGP